MSTDYVFEGNNVSKEHLIKDMMDVKKLERVQSLIKLVPEEKRVLDVGCGFGVISNLLSKKSDSVIGIDMSRVNIKIAKEFNSATNIIFICSNAEDLLGVVPDKFQVVVIAEVIEHVESPYNLLCECYDLLETGGVLIISTPNAVGKINILLNWLKGFRGVEKEERGFGTETDHIYCWDARCLLRLCNVCGFKYVNHKFKGASILMKVVKNE